MGTSFLNRDDFDLMVLNMARKNDVFDFDKASLINDLALSLAADESISAEARLFNDFAAMYGLKISKL